MHGHAHPHTCTRTQAHPPVHAPCIELQHTTKERMDHNSHLHPCHTQTHTAYPACSRHACTHAHTHTHTHTHTPGGSLLSLLLGCYLLLALLNVARLVVGRQAGSFLQAQEQRTPRARSPWVPHSAGALSEFPADFYVAEQQTTGKHTHMRTHTQNQHANPPNTSTGISAYA